MRNPGSMPHLSGGMAFCILLTGLFAAGCGSNNNNDLLSPPFFSTTPTNTTGGAITTGTTGTVTGGPTTTSTVTTGTTAGTTAGTTGAGTTTGTTGASTGTTADGTTAGTTTSSTTTTGGGFTGANAFLNGFTFTTSTRPAGGSVAMISQQNFPNAFTTLETDVTLPQSGGTIQAQIAAFPGTDLLLGVPGQSPVLDLSLANDTGPAGAGTPVYNVTITVPPGLPVGTYNFSLGTTQLTTVALNTPSEPFVLTISPPH